MNNFKLLSAKSLVVLLLAIFVASHVKAVEPTRPEHFAIRELLKTNSFEKALRDSKALSEKGDPYGHYVAGLLLMGNYGAQADWPAAVIYMEKAANSGCDQAAGVLGAILCDGPKAIIDYKKAVKYLEMAAAKNNPVGFDMLGRMHYDGVGLPKNAKKAREYFAIASDLGYSGSQERLGLMMFDGEGGRKDQKMAVTWLNRAAAAGNAPAFHLLGYIHERGMYVRKDLVEAAKNYILATPLEKSVAALENLKRSLSVAQYEEAMRRAKAWKAAKPAVAQAARPAAQPASSALAQKISGGNVPANQASVELDSENIDSWPQLEAIMSTQQVEQFILKEYCAD
ncbi:MAG: hypothetical protein CVV42_19810 [Candidatus Riflebacteria bacterium HGW-Riflebacteria-2]|jgi:hypothetical protein|nr:MAG: hypothetical protein CVV42_19810 [Candidatus Riflebacteria bacterium HGW-Riflebacteria-2]